MSRHRHPSPVLPGRPGFNRLRRLLEGAVASAWGARGTWHVAWAPGRLDVMGGIADYSGSLVAQLPLRLGTFVAVRANRRRQLRLWSASVPGRERTFLTSAHEIGGIDRVDELRRHLDDVGAPRWTRYSIGVGHELSQAQAAINPLRGFDLVTVSTVPIGSGLASSAALEVATARALGSWLDLPSDAVATARLCQRAENRVVGAACGIMDPMTSATGRAGHLLRLLCRPHRVLGHVAIPRGVRLFAIDTGVKHTVGGARYTRARVAAFMGHRILQRLLAPADRPDPMRGHLTRLPITQWQRWRDEVPVRLRGAEFLARFGSTVDRVTRVDPEVTYRVRAATEHPLREHVRVQCFLEAFEAIHFDSDAAAAGLERAGRCMLASHGSYGRLVGLGSPEADWLVKRVRSRGPEHDLYGARITGGGCGGSVAILGGTHSAPAVQALARELGAETGRRVRVVSGSGPGAFEVPVLRLRLD